MKPINLESLPAFVNEFKPYPPSEDIQYYSFNYQRETGGPKIHVLVMSTEQCWSTGMCANTNLSIMTLKWPHRIPAFNG